MERLIRWSDGKSSFHHGKTSTQERAALYRLLEKSDKAALEAGNLAFIMARGIMDRVGGEVMESIRNKADVLVEQAMSA